MKKIAVFLLILLPLGVYAQKATIREETVPIKTYMFSDPDPVPNIGRIYPWFRFDGYTSKGTQRLWKMVILENPYIKVYVTPEIGGKLWAAVEKSTGGAFLYYNHVVKFRDVGMRGPWTSGGLEFNFGAIGHNPTCSTPVDYVMQEYPDGSVSVTVGAIDLPSRTRWNVEIKLDKDKAYVETRAFWANTSPLNTSFYHWMNAAAKTAGNLHYIYPGNYHIGHGGEYGPWPVENGRDLSWYKNNNFGGPKSYHVINAYTNFFGGYWMDDDFGFGHMSPYDDKPGKKLWIWGLSRQGMIWEDLLTDNDGQYTEFQAGKLFNQAAYSSTLTPFKHKEFLPYDADVTTERWFPVFRTGGMVAASGYAVLNVEKKGTKMIARICALQPLQDTLILRSGDKILQTHPLRLAPLQLDSLIFEAPASYKIVLARTRLEYSSSPRDRIVDRPVKPNPHFDWSSAYGLYTKGLEAEKQRRYEEAFRDYELALKKDKAYAPALDRKALLLYRKMKYDSARAVARQSLAVDTYDPLANYVFGLSCKQLGETANARSGFSIAASSPAYRTAGYTELARSYTWTRDYAKAKHYAQKALAYNNYNLTAWQILALLYRKNGDREAADRVLDRLKKIDPTLQFIPFEQWLWGEGSQKDFTGSFRNELPEQYYLELALFYHDLGFDREADQILSLAPGHPVVNLWRAYLAKDHRDVYLKKALQAPVTMVFPYRAETAGILEDLSSTTDNWKVKYYLALIYWNKGREEDARTLFTRCGEKPAAVPFWLAKARLFRDDPEVVAECVRKAHELDPADWRAAHALISYDLDHDKAKEALPLARTFAAKYPERPALGMDYARTLIQTGQYRKCISFLDNYRILPFEGASGGRRLYHQACLEQGLADLQHKKYDRAIDYLRKAKLWPENLGSGKPYDVDERIEDYLIATALERAGKRSKAKEQYNKVAGYTPPPNSRENTKLIFQLWALDKLNKDQEAEDLLARALQASSDNPYLQWVNAVYRKDPGAGEIEKRIRNNTNEEGKPYDISFRDPDFDLVRRVVSFLNQAK